MSFTQSFEPARAERIGAEGVAAAAFDDALKRSNEALDWLRARHADSSLPLLRLPAARDDLASIHAAARTLITLHVERLDEASLGALLMHFMLETFIAARLLGVDPFDQPAVEGGKVLAKRYLTGG